MIGADGRWQQVSQMLIFEPVEFMAKRGRTVPRHAWTGEHKTLAEAQSEADLT